MAMTNHEARLILLRLRRDSEMRLVGGFLTGAGQWGWHVSEGGLTSRQYSHVPRPRPSLALIGCLRADIIHVQEFYDLIFLKK